MKLVCIMRFPWAACPVILKAYDSLSMEGTTGGNLIGPNPFPVKGTGVQRLSIGRDPRISTGENATKLR